MISDERAAKLGLEVRLIAGQLQIKKLLKGGKERLYEVATFDSIPAAEAYIIGYSAGHRVGFDAGVDSTMVKAVEPEPPA